MPGTRRLAEHRECQVQKRHLLGAAGPALVLLRPSGTGPYLHSPRISTHTHDPAPLGLYGPVSDAAAHLGTVGGDCGCDIWRPVLLQQVNVHLSSVPTMDAEQAEQLIDIMVNPELTHSLALRHQHNNVFLKAERKLFITLKRKILVTDPSLCQAEHCQDYVNPQPLPSLAG